MNSRSTRLLAAVAVTGLTLMPAVAEAADCSAEVSPSPGWVGAVITFTGVGLEPNVGYDIRIGGGPIINLAASPTGTFSYQYTIPTLWDSGVSSVGETEWYVFVNSGCKPMGEVAEPYTVLATQPTTTTAAVTTTSATTTTTAATTTTVADTTTTAAATTTVAAADTTTTAPATTTTVTPTSDSGGMSPILIVLLAAIAGALVFVGISIQRSRRH